MMRKLDSAQGNLKAAMPGLKEERKLLENKVLWTQKRSSNRRMAKTAHEPLHNLCSSPNSIRMVKSRRIGWVGRVARKGKMINAYKILV
jgi:hypothetical protein